jgi:hypothetical protein
VKLHQNWLQVLNELDGLFMSIMKNIQIALPDTRCSEHDHLNVKSFTSTSQLNSIKTPSDLILPLFFSITKSPGCWILALSRAVCHHGLSESCCSLMELVQINHTSTLRMAFSNQRLQPDTIVESDHFFGEALIALSFQR